MTSPLPYPLLPGEAGQEGSATAEAIAPLILKSLSLILIALQRCKPMASQQDPVLERFRSALAAVYGDRVERVVLFESRARGDARPDSDYDIAVFLRDMEDRWSEFDILAAIETDIIDDTGAVIRALPYRAGAYGDRTSLMREIRAEGIDL